MPHGPFPKYLQISFFIHVYKVYIQVFMDQQTLILLWQNYNSSPQTLFRQAKAQMAPNQKVLDFIPVFYMTWYTFFWMFYHIFGYLEQLTDLQLMLTINKYFLVDYQFCQTDEWWSNSQLTFFSFRP